MDLEIIYMIFIQYYYNTMKYVSVMWFFVKLKFTHGITPGKTISNEIISCHY